MVPCKVSFISEGESCAALFYQSTNETAGCIVMAHGFAGIKEMRLKAYAHRFNQAGYHVLLFDYRHFGESEGDPRQLLDIDKQHEDWRAAIAHIQTMDCIDADNVIVWGSSFSGGHVLKLAAENHSIAAVISQVPHFFGLVSGLAGGLVHASKLTMVGLVDQVRAMFGLSPFYIDVVGLPGDLAVMNRKGDYDGYMSLLPEKYPYCNKVAARICLKAVFYNPGKYVKQIKVPILLQVGTKDITTPPAPVLRAARSVPGNNVVVKTYKLGHFDVYVEPEFERIIEDQITFLDKYF